MVVETTVGTQSTRGSLKTSRKDSRGELEMRKQNTGMVLGDNMAIASLFPGVHNPSWGHSQKSLMG